MWEKAVETSGPICQGKVINLIENLEYQFRVIAVNKAGCSEPSEASKTVVTKARFRKFLIIYFDSDFRFPWNFLLVRTVAPKIDRRNMRDLTLTANSMLKFDVGISGEPPPTAVWTVSGNPIK